MSSKSSFVGDVLSDCPRVNGSTTSLKLLLVVLLTGGGKGDVATDGNSTVLDVKVG
jgi:hypothetical protein